MDPSRETVEVVSWGLTDEGSFDEALALRRAEELEDRLRAVAPDSDDAPGETAFEVGGPSSSLTEAAHAEGCAKILEAIARGDVYQANLTARFDVSFAGDASALFERLLESSPAPHAAYLEAPGLTVVSASPEQLIRVRGREVTSRPIKGTAPRSSDPARDRDAASALLRSPKDAAELVMITDLLRNDLGKVCEPGSVRVPALRALESYAHVHHLVSTIRGELRTGLDALDALAATFPCGSIAGAPKRRAMQILAELEPAPRDVYTGTVGWIGFDRSADWSVAIRTGMLVGGTFSFGSGGGIVIDSVPGAEWEELLVKAKGMAQALGVALETETMGRRA
jgi:anthranilate/para-aminobenzoate synthase component I